jgi:signal transduction histidine kinase
MLDKQATHTATAVEKIEGLLAQLDQRKKERNTASAGIGEEAYELAKQAGEKALLIKAATSLSHYFTDITSEFDKAIANLLDVISVLDSEEDAEAKSEFFRRLGLNYDYVGELAQSKQAYDDSVKLLEGRTKLSETGFLTLARSLFNESIIYGNMGLDTLKKEYLHRAFGYFQKANYRPGIARCYISFGVDAYERKVAEQSVDFYEKAIAIAEEINDIPPFCIALGNAGIVYADMGNKPKAVECAERSIASVKNQTNKHFELNIYQMAGRVHQVVGNHEKANFWYSEAERLYIEMNKTIDNFELFKYWAETLFSLGRFEEAYLKMVRFDQQKDQLHKINKQAELNDVTLRFEYEEGKKEQELLKKKNAEIEKYLHKLEMSNYELNQFAHVASHDMKEPLRTISNYAQLLNRTLNTEENPTQKEYLNYINEGAKRMMNVIQSLLQLSKINSTQKKDPVNMNEVMDEVLLALKLNITEKNAVVHFAPLPQIAGDRVHITQLMQNLIGNGIKYNQSANPRIEVIFKERENDHCFEISDNGIGIAPEYRDKVFIIFQRLHSRYEYDGTGIGLAICKKIIDSLGGKIWIEDSLLGGTKFCFTIPK